MAQRLHHSSLLILLMLMACCLPGNLAATDAQLEQPPAWPEGEQAYDNMVSLTEFGYRQIDSAANQNARSWIASELEGMDYEVERQSFTTDVCMNCQNIVVTINGTLEDDWRVVGAHHDANCYSPPVSYTHLTLPTKRIV